MVGEELLTDTASLLEKFELLIVTLEMVALDAPLMFSGRFASDIVQLLTDAPLVLTTTPVHVPELAAKPIPPPLRAPFMVRLDPDGKLSVAPELPVKVTPDGTVTLPAIGHDPEETVALYVTVE